MEVLIQSLCLSIGVLGMSNSQEKRACRYMPTIVKESNRHNIDPAIFVALIYTESCFNPWEVSHANACGLTQVIPKWTGGKASGRKKYTCKQPLTRHAVCFLKSQTWSSIQKAGHASNIRSKARLQTAT